MIHQEKIKPSTTIKCLKFIIANQFRGGNGVAYEPKSVVELLEKRIKQPPRNRRNKKYEN